MKVPFGSEYLPGKASAFCVRKVTFGSNGYLLGKMGTFWAKGVPSGFIPKNTMAVYMSLSENFTRALVVR